MVILINYLIISPSPIARDLLEKIFVYEPEVRLTADQAISHEYFVKYREPNDEVSVMLLLRCPFLGIQ